MNITDILCHDLCSFDLLLDNKDDVFSVLSETLYKNGLIESQVDFIKAVNQRENFSSSYIGNMVALPHCSSNTVTKPFVVTCKTLSPLCWEPLEHFNVQYIVLFAVPSLELEDSVLSLLSQMIELLIEDDFLAHFFMANSGEEVLRVFEQYLH